MGRKEHIRIVPKIGDQVRLRGRHPVGNLLNVTDRNWAFVEWLSKDKGPKICHLDELEACSMFEE